MNFPHLYLFYQSTSQLNASQHNRLNMCRPNPKHFTSHIYRGIGIYIPCYICFLLLFEFHPAKLQHSKQDLFTKSSDVSLQKRRLRCGDLNRCQSHNHNEYKTNGISQKHEDFLLKELSRYLICVPVDHTLNKQKSLFWNEFLLPISFTILSPQNQELLMVYYMKSI